MNTAVSIPSSKQADKSNRFIREIRERSNKLIEIFLIGYFAFGLAIASYYDTWFIAIAVGGIVLATYFLSKKLFPNSTLNQYVASAAVGIFMGQFIYQMHGMFEMHFFAFIGATLMITYQNWKAQIPLTVVIVLHHAVFGYIQYQSFTADSENVVYFTQLDYMDLQTFIIHCFLAVIILGICCLWAYDLNKRTRENSRNILAVEEITNKLTLNLEFASQLAEGVYDDELQPDENDPLGNVLKELQKKLKSQSGVSAAKR
jgi:methyl-accepting chemotaxis protein